MEELCYIYQNRFICKIIYLFFILLPVISSYLINCIESGESDIIRIVRGYLCIDHLLYSELSRSSSSTLLRTQSR